MIIDRRRRAPAQLNRAQMPSCLGNGLYSIADAAEIPRIPVQRLKNPNTATAPVCTIQCWHPAARLAMWATRRLKPRSTVLSGSHTAASR